LAAVHPAVSESTRYGVQHFIGYQTGAPPKHALQRTGAEPFSLMSHWFYSMIGFGRAAQIQTRERNVV
jgi:hypothetical protein